MINLLRKNKSNHKKQRVAFSKIATLRLNSDFNYVLKKGIKIDCKYATIIAAEPIEPELKIGIICSRKYNKRAVVRNRTRRLFKEALRLIQYKLPPKHFVFIPKKTMDKIKMQQFQSHLIDVFNKNGLLLQDSREKTKVSLLTYPFIGLIKVYRFLTPWLRCCRFYPSCSEYAIQALKKHGLFKGILLIVYRIIRCQPYCKGGYDPVPDEFTLKIRKRRK